jgi:hypothetical protein
MKGISLHEDRKNKFFASILSLAARKYYWAPARLARIALGLATNIPKQLQIFHALAASAYSDTIKKDPRFPFRYLGEDYLARGLSYFRRASCFVHHYKRLNELLPDRFLRRILDSDVTLSELSEGNNSFRIAMSMTKVLYQEGEMSINFEVDGAVGFVLSFTIVPGWVVEVDAPDVVLITRLQGMKGSRRQIFDATRTLHEIAPAALLVAALQGIASALNIQSMAGVCAVRQQSYNEIYSTAFKEAYDDFFTGLGATRTTESFFHSPIPLPEKPITSIKKGHKTRTRKKREFKQQLADNVYSVILANC